MQLSIRYVLTSLLWLLVFGALIFIPAGTFHYWQGWLFLLVFTIATTVIGLYLVIRDPVLLDRRIKAGLGAETRPVQKTLVSLLFVSFLALIASAGRTCRPGYRCSATALPPSA